MIRKATAEDIDAIERIYDEIHTAEENGEQTVGWIRNVYPTRTTAETALTRGDLFVMEEDGTCLGTAIINKAQVDCYTEGAWEYEAPEDGVCVLHTLVISPKTKGKGCGRQFVQFYEQYAMENHAPELRMDTNERNRTARRFYAGLGYKEVGIVPTVFNGIPGVGLVLLEKHL